MGTKNKKFRVSGESVSTDTPRWKLSFDFLTSVLQRQWLLTGTLVDG